MKKLYWLLAIFIIPTTIFAQNLVINGSFEEIGGKMKGLPTVELATGWYSATAAKVDLFTTTSKEETMKTPNNKYGREVALTGGNYAGFLAYSYQGIEPRSYVMTELVQPLEKGKEYCIRFNVSLSDLAKFGINNIGAYVSSKPFNMQDSKEPLLLEPQIRHSKNKVIDTQVFWETICGIYTAQGGERYLIIGNFAPDKSTDAKKMKKAVQFKESQIGSAYYFLDDVSLEPLNDEKGCACEKEEFVDVPNVVYKKQETNVTDEELSEEIATMKIEFDSLSAELKGMSVDQVKKLASFLKAKSNVSIVIIGHTSDYEADASKKSPDLNNLSSKRAQVVADYLMKEGIDKKRFKVEGVKNLHPFSYGSSWAEQAKNRAVNIELLE